MGRPELSPTAEEMLDWLDRDKGRSVICVGGRWYSRAGYGMPHRRRESLRDAVRYAMFGTKLKENKA